MITSAFWQAQTWVHDVLIRGNDNGMQMNSLQIAACIHCNINQSSKAWAHPVERGRLHPLFVHLLAPDDQGLQTCPFGIPGLFHWALSCRDLRINSYGLSSHVLSLRGEPYLAPGHRALPHSWVLNCTVASCIAAYSAYGRTSRQKDLRHPRNTRQERLQFRSQHVCKQDLKRKDIIALSGGHLLIFGDTADQHKAEEQRARHSAAHRRKLHKMLGRQLSHTGTTASPRCSLTSVQRPQHLHHRVHEAGMGKSLAC